MNTLLISYVNRSSLSHTNKEKNDALIVICSVTFAFSFVYQNNENLIYYSSTIKGSLFLFFSLFLSLTLFTMIYKKHTSLLSAKIETDSLNYGKLDTFESIYWYLHLFLLLIVNHHSSCSSSSICDNNENVFMKGNLSRCFGQSLNRKYYKLVHMLRHYYFRILLRLEKDDESYHKYR
jgi:hypothetical protein